MLALKFAGLYKYLIASSVYRDIARVCKELVGEKL